jgi:hypothetical protein
MGLGGLGLSEWKFSAMKQKRNNNKISKGEQTKKDERLK